MANGEVTAEEKDREFLAQLGEDSLTLLRMNIILMGIYVSVIALLYRGGGETIVQTAFESHYILLTIVAWIGSVVGSVVFYLDAKIRSISTSTNVHPWFTNELVAIYQTGGVAFATIVGLFAFLAAIFEGLSEQGLLIENLAVIVGFSFLIVITIISVFFYARIIRIGTGEAISRAKDYPIDRKLQFFSDDGETGENEEE